LPELVKKLRVFFSSPGDLEEERKIAFEVVGEVNQDIGSIEGFILEPIAWETHTYSAQGTYPQAVISSQIGSTYDIFLGMMSTRFGSPTPSFGSGTEEEYNIALDLRKQHGFPEIAFLFHSPSRNVDSIDLAQLSRVHIFREKVSSDGVLYKIFHDDTQFRLELRRTLVGLSRGIMKHGSDALSERATWQNAAIFDPLSNYNELLKADSELAASVTMEQAVRFIAEANQSMVILSKSLAVLTKSLTSEASSISRLATQGNVPKMISSVERAIHSTRTTCNQFTKYVPIFHDSLQQALTSAQRSLEIFKARGELTSEVSEAILAPLSSARASYQDLSKTIGASIESLKVVKGLGQVFDIERRKLVALFADTAVALDLGVESMGIVEEILSGAE
jgi:hypothetical protein